MANIIIKSDERIQREKQMLQNFGYDPSCATPEQREYSEAASYYNEDAYSKLVKMEERYNK